VEDGRYFALCVGFVICFRVVCGVRSGLRESGDLVVSCVVFLFYSK